MLLEFNPKKQPQSRVEVGMESVDKMSSFESHSEPPVKPGHSIRIAAKRSGLTTHVIRVWEKRYAAVKPHRTGTNRRLYSDEDIGRLTLLRQLTQAGHSIANVAALEVSQLRSILEVEKAGGLGTQTGSHSIEALHESSDLERGGLEACQAAVRSMDPQGLTNALRRFLVQFGHQALVVKLAAPLAQWLGDAWERGELSAAHEHFCSSQLKAFLMASTDPSSPHPSAPSMIVTTPRGQAHEMGALLAYATASNAGWRVIYLGPNLPAPDIANAAVQHQCRAVALSLVYPLDDPIVRQELVQLRHYLPMDKHILVGGRAAKSYHATLQAIHADSFEDVSDFYGWLKQM